MKKLGFGLMRLPMVPGGKDDQVDLELSRQMLDEFMAAGFTYFDTAYFYHGGASETVFRDLIVKRYPRDAYTITDKLPIGRKPKAEELQGLFDEQLEKCGVDYFDYYWLHALNKDFAAYGEEIGVFDFLQQMKAQGKTRHIGFSYHDSAEVLDDILTRHPEMEYVQLQLNYLDWENPKVQARECYEVCVKHGKPVIVMEPVKGGSLAGLPNEAEALLRGLDPQPSIASWAVRFAASLDNVMMVLSGMSTLEQVRDNCAFMADLKPLTEREVETIMAAGELVKKAVLVPCTSCRYCVEGCPQQIEIPTLFAMYNNYSRFHTQKDTWKKRYQNKVKEGGAASSCIGCGQCEEQCPQHIEIPKWLKHLAAELE